MGFFITPDGEYYEGTSVAEGSLEVPQRPDRSYKWSGTEWIIDEEYVKDQIRSEIREAELREMLPHGVRVFMLLSMEDKAMTQTGLTRPQVIAALTVGNPGYRRVKEFHDFIASKEALL